MLLLSCALVLPYRLVCVYGFKDTMPPAKSFCSVYKFYYLTLFFMCHLLCLLTEFHIKWDERSDCTSTRLFYV